MGVLTKAQAQQHLEEKGKVVDIVFIIDAIRDEDGGTVVIFTDNHCYQPAEYNVNVHSSAASTTYFKRSSSSSSGYYCQVKPRKGLENGRIESIEQFISVFIDHPILETEEELLAFLQKGNIQK